MCFYKMKYFIIALLAAGAHAIELTPETWDEKTAGKAVFVKFFAPWCGHCKRMKPSWDALMEEFSNSAGVLVADVDCVGTGKPLCDKVGVKGFPTIKYGDPNDLQDYKGGRDRDDLSKFAASLKPGCRVDNVETCSDKDKEIIKGLKDKNYETLEEMVLEELKDKEKVQKDFKAEVDKLQTKFMDISAERDNALLVIKDRYNIGIVKQLIKNRDIKTDL